MAIAVNETNCIGCAACVLFCPELALAVSPWFVVEVDTDACTECLTCLDCCSNEALTDDADG